MTSGRKVKIVGLTLATLLLLTGCGGKNPAKNSDTWTAKEQNNISKKWLPARSQECQLFINIFQNFNTVIAEQSTATSNVQKSMAIRDFQGFTSQATLALTQEIKITKSNNIKDYAQRYLKFVTNLADTKHFDQDRKSTRLNSSHT